MKISDVPTDVQGLIVCSLFNQTVGTAISVSQFDAEERQFDRMSPYLRCFYTGRGGSDTAAERPRARTPLVTATTAVDGRLPRSLGEELTETFPGSHLIGMACVANT